MLLRLLQSIENGTLPDELIESINSLEGHVEARLHPQNPTLESGELKNTIVEGSGLVRMITRSRMEVGEVRELFCKVSLDFFFCCFEGISLLDGLWFSGVSLVITSISEYQEYL